MVRAYVPRQPSSRSLREEVAGFLPMSDANRRQPSLRSALADASGYWAAPWLLLASAVTGTFSGSAGFSNPVSSIS